MRPLLSLLMRLLNGLGYVGQELAQIVALYHLRARRWIVKQLSE